MIEKQKTEEPKTEDQQEEVGRQDSQEETQEQEEEQKTLEEQIAEDTDDRYEYYEVKVTIEGLGELLADYEVAMERAEKTSGEKPMYLPIDMDEGYAASIYNAIKELQYMQKIGGHRR